MTEEQIKAPPSGMRWQFSQQHNWQGFLACTEAPAISKQSIFLRVFTLNARKEVSGEIFKSFVLFFSNLLFWRRGAMRKRDQASLALV